MPPLHFCLMGLKGDLPPSFPGPRSPLDIVLCMMRRGWPRTHTTWSGLMDGLARPRSGGQVHTGYSFVWPRER